MGEPRSTGSEGLSGSSQHVVSEPVDWVHAVLLCLLRTIGCASAEAPFEIGKCHTCCSQMCQRPKEQEVSTELMPSRGAGHLTAAVGRRAVVTEEQVASPFPSLRLYLAAGAPAADPEHQRTGDSGQAVSSAVAPMAGASGNAWQRSTAVTRVVFERHPAS